MITKKIFVKKFASGFLTTLIILAGMGAAFAVWTASETSWSETSFTDGQDISNNMLSGPALGYVKNSDGTKLYWKKISSSQLDINSAAMACANVGMWLPSSDQLSYYSANNLSGTDYDGTVKGIQSTINAGSRHWGTQMHDSISCSTPGYSCSYYLTRYPNSWSSYTTVYGYNAQYYLCVYKQWY